MMVLTLQHQPSPRLLRDGQQTGYWVTPFDSGAQQHITLLDLDHGRKLVGRFIARNNLIQSNFLSAQVRLDGQLLGQFDYAGKFHNLAEVAK